ncbi:TBC-domain-containing protein [Aspergillus karnatakaensis]|uniref:TBC domain-containing protein n=1 Tax=Aspergillus karnatakaensis TaxID=1810916 RepID=UPI003CCDF9C5
MAECDLRLRPPQRRSSSQTSSSSRQSQKAKAIRTKAQKRHSASNATETDTDLTSFPSLSPDRSPHGFLGQPALNRALSGALLNGGDNSDGAMEHRQNRRATLAKLTTASSSSGRAALFEDAVPIRDFPGALHLADDAHIERLIATNGAVKLVRQFARDLAQRDAEISALRQRADARERELKKMLREASVSNKDIERRLYAMETSPKDGKDGDYDSDQTGKASRGVGGLMQQAMIDGIGAHLPNSDSEDENGIETAVQSTIRKPSRLESDAKSGTSSIDSGAPNRKRQGSMRSWQDFLFGSAAGSRKTSRASSIMSDLGEDEEHLRHPMPPGTVINRRKPLDDQLFHPVDGQAGDDASTHSRKSSKSVSSWTVKLFAGNQQTNRDESPADRNRGRASSANRERNRTPSSALPPNTKHAMSAVAALKRINSNTSIKGVPGRPNGSGTTPRSGQLSRRQPASSVSQGVAAETTAKNPTNLGPVEMDAILPLESRPPTLTPIYNDYMGGELLTDRFGFIYDQRRKRRQREASLLKNSGRQSIAETLDTFRSDNSDDRDGSDVHERLSSADDSHRSLGSISPIDPEKSSQRWQDYLVIPSVPTELLSHTPSAGPIVSLTTAGEDSPRSNAVAVDKRGSVSVNSNSQPSASTSTIIADRPEFAGSSADEIAVIASGEHEPVKLLLEQLTDLHDWLQRERTVRWNEFLRKVRAERRKEGEAAAASDRPMQSEMPEVTLADGEMVGISGLGNKGKVGRAKWREFRNLVLGGIPVALRSKIWSECSGASSMRVPGYYDDLVKGVGGIDPDSSVVAQIDMDINRTLTDNVFFRKGPGVEKLKEVLLAYSRRNPEVGYCQGMNLITGSLLLITPTAEDTFWLLASIIEVILPKHYYDHGLLASRADQVVLRQYISLVLPKLSEHLENLGVELEALTFQWFLSVFTDCLSAEALYRVWDVVLCLDVSSAVSRNPASSNTASSASPSATRENNANSTASTDTVSGSGGGSTFLFQVALALLKLNEHQLLTTCGTPAELYTYINHQMTNHAISIDGLIQASEALRNVVRPEDVVAKRAEALKEMQPAQAI